MSRTALSVWGSICLWVSLGASLPAFAQSFPLSLRAALEQAQAHNPQLLAAERGVVLAQSGISVAGVTPNPRLALDIPFGEAETKRTLTFEQPLELGGKREARLILANDQVRLAGVQLELLRWQIRTDVYRSYAELAIARAAREQAERTVGLNQRLVDITQRRLATGDVAEAEVIQATFALERARQRLEPATNRVRQANIRLDGLLGRAPNESIQVEDRGVFNLSVEQHQPAPVNQPPMPELSTLQGLARRTRLDLALAEAQVRLGTDQLRLAQTLRVPDIALAGGFIWDPVAQTTAATLGVRVDLPVFNNHQGEVDQAVAVQSVAQAQVEALERQVESEVAAAYEDFTSAQRLLLRDRTVLLPQANRVLELAQKSYQAGQSGITDVLVVQQSVQDQRDAYYADVLTYQSALNTLERAVNQPLMELPNAASPP
ncbi:TolC family protein [Anthocerotibacter panamensis]|uniref:TolC family protein n=1 Tax=Anthocerotibacter panamensis TaxID=2857077 RepID=UPI001C4080E5|nr:TolC family protein [Anthocerotibacter panamensis]